jgi:hypothetical protein
MTADPGPRRRITPGDWLGPKSWILSVVALVLAGVAALTTRDWLVVSTLLAVAVIYLVIPPLRRRLRIYRAELGKRHPS